MIAADRDDEAMVMKVLVPIADDSEDIETACITDVLARAGAEVTTASVMDGRLQVKLARGLKVTADCAIADCASTKWDAICCPGGMPGAEHLRDSAPLKALLEARIEPGRCILESRPGGGGLASEWWTIPSRGVPGGLA